MKIQNSEANATSQCGRVARSVNMRRLSRFVVLLFGLNLAAATQAPCIELNDGNKMPIVALGTGRGTASENAPLNEVRQAVYWAIEAGYRHIDTAAIYFDETEVGQGIKDAIDNNLVTREQLFVTTKLWSDKHRQQQVVPALKDSLQKLGLDYVDLYLIHFPVAVKEDFSFDDVDYLETWRGMEEARALGLTRSIGVSNFNASQVDRIITNSRVWPAVNQVEVNPTLTQEALVTHCQELGVAVMAFSPFGFVIDRGLIPIPKSVNKKRLAENIDLFDFSLTKEEIQLINRFNKNKRVIDFDEWKDYPYFPYGEYEELLCPTLGAKCRTALPNVGQSSSTSGAELFYLHVAQNSPIYIRHRTVVSELLYSVHGAACTINCPPVLPLLLSKSTVIISILVTVLQVASIGVTTEKVQMNDGNWIPTTGFGTYMVDLDDRPYMPQAVKWAIQAGYRHIDSAALYASEDKIGEATSDLIKRGIVKRSEIFITTKLSFKTGTRNQVVPAIQDCLKRLQTDYVDLFLIHTPRNVLGVKNHDYLEIWKGLEDAKRMGLTRSIGVSNFNSTEINKILVHSKTPPAVNQIETNPTFTNLEIVAYCQSIGIVVTGYAPLGFLVPRSFNVKSIPPTFKDPILVGMAKKYGVGVNQVLLRYLVDRNVFPLVASLNKEHIESNIDIFNLTMSPKDILLINEFNKNVKVHLDDYDGLDQQMRDGYNYMKEYARQNNLTQFENL
ncbi:uncharacterized protein [Maniola hyperantus]|uniref:uncharacterized protein n=1 Tax=Aphantopus hyperantus TaxID=2795564 RepID=UPI0037489813